MAYRRSTLRRMPPVTRRYARVVGDLASIVRRLKNLTDEISQLELDSRALMHAKQVKPSTTLEMPQTEDDLGFEA